MTTGSIERFDEAARRRVGAFGRTAPDDDELIRHGVYTRVVHWAAAIFFVLALLSGFAIYSPWLFRGVTPLFGGGAMTRMLHPWFSLGFAAVFFLQFLNWLALMTWTSDDRKWLGHFRAYVTNAEPLEPEHVGFFNAGQKLYFWAIVVSVIAFLASGVPLWFPQTFSRTVVALSYVLHDVAGLVMMVGFIVHVYEATAAASGTFQAMTRGTVEKRWAWTHHPAWYRSATGRDPRADHERARQASRP